MSNQKIVTETALSALASDIKTALSGKANSNDVYPKSQTYNRTEIDNALELKADKSELYNVYPTDQESGSIAHITDGADNIPVKSLVSQIVATGGGGTPDAPITINGFDNGVITRCGKNLFNSALEQGTINSSTGGINPSTTRCVNTDLIPIPQGDNRLSSNKKIYEVAYFDKAKNFITTGYFNTNIAVLNTSYAYFRISIRNEDNSTILPSDIEIQLELGNTATTYEAYTSNNYTFAFGQTVYGGHFDNKGNLTINGNRFKLVDNNNIALQGYSDNNNVWRVLRATSNVINNVKQLCNIATYNVNAWSPADNRANTFVIGGEGNLYLQLPKSVANTLEDFITYITNNDVFFYHELTTPITLSITSQDIPTLLGENNIFSNTGDVEVDYHADIGLYIDKKISSLAQA